MSMRLVIRTLLYRALQGFQTSGALTDLMHDVHCRPQYSFLLLSFIGDAFHPTFTPEQLLSNEIVPKNVGSSYFLVKSCT